MTMHIPEALEAIGFRAKTELTTMVTKDCHGTYEATFAELGGHCHGLGEWEYRAVAALLCDVRAAWEKYPYIDDADLKPAELALKTALMQNLEEM